MSSSQTSIFTIGHSNHPWEKFAALLQAAKIETLADIRSFPRSRLAHFNQAQLCSRLTTVDSQLEAVAKFFHGLIFIHPFTDGNGRVARSLLMQQCVEFFGHVDMSLFNRGVEYYAALQAADGNDIKPLKELVRRAISD